MSSAAGTATVTRDPAVPSWRLPAYQQGTLVTSAVTFALSGTPTDPTAVVALVERGDGYRFTGSPAHGAAGAWSLAVDTAPAAGEYTVSWSGTGAVGAAVVDTFLVLAAA